MYQADKSFVESLARQGYDVWTIELWMKWVGLSTTFEALLDDIAEVFANVKLEDGIGMLEADGIDNYVEHNEQMRRRKRDEREYWQDLTPKELNANYCSFGFTDARGGLFLLPAYLLADLRDLHNFDFVSDLVKSLSSRTYRKIHTWVERLNEKQADALCKLFGLLKFHPEYHSRGEQLSAVIKVIQSGDINNLE